MIYHTVFFRLKHLEGSPEESAFLEEPKILGTLPSVKNFERLRQISHKNSFRYGFSMRFDDQAAYNAYNVHPIHIAYVRERWLPEVSEFMEIDYVAL